MINPATVASATVVDRSGELSKTSFNLDPDLWLAWVADPTAGGPENTRVTAFTAAWNGICDGTRIRRHLTRSYRASNVANASAGQREERWLVTYEDTSTNAIYTMELPCRKQTLQPDEGTDFVDITEAPFSTFVTALEDVALSPDGNPINVLSIRIMGRNI